MSYGEGKTGGKTQKPQLSIEQDESGYSSNDFPTHNNTRQIPRISVTSVTVSDVRSDAISIDWSIYGEDTYI